MMNDNENNLFEKLVYGDPSEVEALLKSGVNIDEHKNHRGETALHNTLFTGYMDRAKLLLKNNANPNIQDNKGETLLHTLNSIDKMEFLFQNATNTIDLEIKNNHGFTPLYSSALNRNIEAMELLLKNGANANSTDINKISALQSVIIHNNIKAIELLIKYKADVNSIDNNGTSALQSAIHINNLKTVELLLENGANANSTDTHGFSVLHYAMSTNRLKAAELLLKHGADVNSKDNIGFTPLSPAINSGNIKATELLIKYKADINSKDPNGVTPLHSATMYQRKKLAELLLKSGATLIVDEADSLFISSKISDLLNIRVSEESIVASLLTSNTPININDKFRALSSEPRFTKDVHRKIIEKQFNDTTKEWGKNVVTEESLNNNKFKDIIKTYKEYKDFAIDYREQSGSPCQTFENYNTISAEGLIIPKPTDFAEEVEKLYNIHHKVQSLSYLAFKKLASSHHNLEITQDNNITLYTTGAKDTEQQLYIEYNIKNQKAASVCLDTQEFTGIMWNDDNSSSILADLFDEAKLTGDIA